MSAAVARLRALRVRVVQIKAVESLLAAAKLLEPPPCDVSGIRRLMHACPVDLDSVVSFVRSVAVAEGADTEPVDRFSDVLDDLRNREDLTRLAPPLTGGQVMELLCIEPGPQVGQALRFLLEQAFEYGPLSRDAAQRALLRWADERSLDITD